MINVSEYLKELCEHNKFVKENKFSYGRCASGFNLGEAISNIRSATAYIVATDVCKGMTELNNGCWQQKLAFTFFIMKECKFNDEADREKVLAVCREVRRQFLSKMLFDSTFPDDPNASKLVKNAGIKFDLKMVGCTEYGDMKLNNCAGLEITVPIIEPVDIHWNKEEWLDMQS